MYIKNNTQNSSYQIYNVRSKRCMATSNKLLT